MQLTDLKFVSEKRERDFNKLNIYTVESLVRHYPRDYLDLRHVTLLKDAYHNDYILTAAEVTNVEVNRYARRPYVKAYCSQGESSFTAIWFNQPYVAEKLRRGTYLFYGRVQNSYGFGCQMTNPAFESAERNSSLKGIIPVYPLSGSLTQGVVRIAIRDALKKVRLPSHIPAPIAQKYRLMPLAEAYKKVHCPETAEDVREGAKRIALEEYFLLISAFKVIKGGREEARLNEYSVTESDVRDFMSRFPFEFTGGQISAVNDVFSALHSPHKMNMLLQGDVGSGKTAVALTAVYMAVKSGYQAAMIAPTEVLAQQNAALLKKFFPDYRVTAKSAKSKKVCKPAKLKSSAVPTP